MNIQQEGGVRMTWINNIEKREKRERKRKLFKKETKGQRQAIIQSDPESMKCYEEDRGYQPKDRTLMIIHSTSTRKKCIHDGQRIQLVKTKTKQKKTHKKRKA